MANNQTRTLQIPIEFRDAGHSMERLLEQVKKATGQVDLTTKLGKNVTNLQRQLEVKLSDYQQLMLEPTLDPVSMRKAEKMITDFSQKVNRIFNAINGANVFDLNISYEQLKSIELAQEKVKDLTKELRELQNAEKSSAATSLTRAKETTLLDRARKTSGFRDDVSVAENRQSMTTEVASHNSRIESLKAEQQAAEQAREVLLGLQKTRDQLAKKASQARQTQSTAQYLSYFAAIDESFFAGSKGGYRSNSGITNDFINLIMGGKTNSQIKIEDQHGAGIILKQLGLKDLVGKSSDGKSNIVKATREEITKAVLQAFGVNEQNAKSRNQLSGLWAGVSKAQERASSYAAQYNTPGLIQKRQETIRQEEDFTKQWGDIDQQIKDNQDTIEARQQEIAALTSTRDELIAVNSALADFEERLKNTIKNKEEERKGARQNQAQAEMGARSAASTETEPLQQGASDLRVLGQVGARHVAEDVETQKQQSDFTQRLKQMTSQWLSASQIVQAVKSGIRSAYNDIQNLDKAMTNIAVVTDMSVSDLWGKIDEYMSIAKQYGVSTQGVYEVSQLFYQQGKL